MQVNQYETLSQAIEGLHQRGFTEDFDFKNGKLHIIKSNLIFSPEDIVIVEYHRFEGNSSSDDMAVVYAIQTTSGEKGTIVDAYGVYSSQELADFIDTVKVEIT